MQPSRISAFPLPLKHTETSRRRGHLKGDNIPTRPCFSNAQENSAPSPPSSPLTLPPTRPGTTMSYFSESFWN